MKPTFCAPFPGMHQQFTQEDMDYLNQVLVQVRKPRMNPNLSPQGFRLVLIENQLRDLAAERRRWQTRANEAAAHVKDVERRMRDLNDEMGIIQENVALQRSVIGEMI